MSGPVIADATRPPAVHAQAATAIRELIRSWSERYGDVICTVRPNVAHDGTLTLSGEVLLEAQRSALLEAVAAATGQPVTDAIAVLSQLPTAEGWVIPKGDLADVWSRPNGERATQITANDPPARVLVRRPGWLVVQLADDTVGWSHEAEWRPAAQVGVKDRQAATDGRAARDVPDLPDVPVDVESWRAAYRGAWRPVEPAAWRTALAPWLGTPYVWGGTTLSGVDCSGLTQRLYRSVAGLGLPRHSVDQVAAGTRVARSRLAAGDLLYLTQIDTGVKHVAIVLDGHPLAVGHASRAQDGVVEEPLDEILKRYHLRAACRFGLTGSDGSGAVAALDVESGVATSLEIASSSTTSRVVLSSTSGDPVRLSTPVDAVQTSTPLDPVQSSTSVDPAPFSNSSATLQFTWADLHSLAGRNVHVVGLANTEGAAMVGFLFAEGVRRLTVHDFQPPQAVEAAFRRFHVGMARDERDAAWAELAGLPVERRFGDRYLEGIEAAEAVFAGQAWYLYPPNYPRLADVRGRGVPFHTLAELYFGLSPAPILAVTGSNGKSTTSRLAQAILERMPRRVYYAGNERRSVQVLDRLRSMTADELLVLEISNRQLIEVAPRPHIGVITNVLPNHLDEHGGSFEAYAAVKRKLVAQQGPSDFAVLNADNPVTRGMAEGLSAQVYWFSTRGSDAVARGAYLDPAGHIRLRHGPHEAALDAGPIGAARIVGRHNHENILAAAAAAWLAGASVDAVQRGVAAFRGLRHRAQFVWGAGGVAYYDDLNSTTPQATLAALQALPGPVVLIVGGDDKGLDCTELAAWIRKRVRRLVVLPGAGAERIERAVGARAAGGHDNSALAVDHFMDLPAAVADVAAKAQPGDQVLLSPACPNFFRHFYMGEDAEELGFKKLLRTYAKVAGEGLVPDGLAGEGSAREGLAGDGMDRTEQGVGGDHRK